MSAPMAEQPPPYDSGYQPGPPPQSEPLPHPGYGAPVMDSGYPPGPQAGYAGMPQPSGPQYGQPGYEAPKMDPGYPPGPQAGYPGMPPQYGQPGCGAPKMDPGYPPFPQAGYAGMPLPSGPQYGQPGQAYYPPPSQGPPQHTTIIIGPGGRQAYALINAMHWSPKNITCPQCQQVVLTKTSYETGTFTWLMCGILAFFGCIFGCCLIPFYVDSCKDVKHSCPNCNAELATYRRM